MRALIVDDSRAIRRLLSQIVRKLGYEVVEAANGREALAVLAKSQHPDVVLVDWNMPEMNGLEFVREVRDQREYANLPLMMVTSETEVEQVMVALAAGANEYVMKPFDAQTLADKLQLLCFAAN